MTLQIMQLFFMYIVCISAFEELIFAEGQGSVEMIEHGRIQYQVRDFYNLVNQL